MRKTWLKTVKDFYKDVTENWRLEDSEHELLVTTCDRLDRFHRCRRQIRRDGESYVTESGTIKPHPLLNSEKQAYMNFLSGYRALKLTDEPGKRPAHRPPKGSGV